MKLGATQVIAIVNQKGGCGKTTSAVALSAALSRLGYTVCLVDADPQCNATESFGIVSDSLVAEGQFTLVDVFLKEMPIKDIALGFLPERFEERLFLVPAIRGLSSVPMKLNLELEIAAAESASSVVDEDELRRRQRLRLRRSIDSVRGHIDFVVIDTPPTLDILMHASLVAADRYIVPVFPSGHDLRGLELLSKTATRVQETLNPALRLAGVLLGNYDQRARLDKDIRGLLTKRFGEEGLFRTAISASVRLREATVGSSTVFELPAAQRQAAQFLELAEELVERLERDSEAESAQVAEKVSNG